MSQSLIEKFGSADVLSGSLGPRSVIDDQPSPNGPVWIQVIRSLASLDPFILGEYPRFDHAPDVRQRRV
jgi:hypothetical protein